VSNAFVSYLTTRGQAKLEKERSTTLLELEKQKFKANLIIEAVKTGDKRRALDNLQFFVEAGFWSTLALILPS
jgi:hypothetical protein